MVDFEPNDSQQTTVEKLNELQESLAVSPLIDFEPNDSAQTRVLKLDALQSEAEISPTIDFEPNDSPQDRTTNLNRLQFPSGVTHYWPLNETSGEREDLVGGSPFTPSGDVVRITGPRDGAVRVNTSNTEVALFTSPITSLRTTGFWTFNFWYKKIGASPQDYVPLEQQNSAAFGNVDSQIILAITPGDAGLALYDDTTSDFTGFNAPVGLFDEQWHMVTFTRTTLGDTVSLYVDAVLAGSGTNAKGICTTPTSVYVGQQGGASADAGIGMADLGTWERALEEHEITTLYNEGVPIRPISPN